MTSVEASQRDGKIEMALPIWNSSSGWLVYRKNKMGQN